MTKHTRGHHVPRVAQKFDPVSTLDLARQNVSEKDKQALEVVKRLLREFGIDRTRETLDAAQVEAMQQGNYEEADRAAHMMVAVEKYADSVARFDALPVHERAARTKLLAAVRAVPQDTSLACVRVVAQAWSKVLEDKEAAGPEAVYGQLAIKTFLPELEDAYLQLSEQEDAAAMDYAQTCLTTHFFIRWAQFGLPTFSLSYGLAAKLLLTDCSTARLEDVKWPFDSFVVQLPGPDPLITYLCGVTGKEVPAHYLKFHRYLSAGNRASNGKLTETHRQTLNEALDASRTASIYIGAQSNDSRTVLHRNAPEPQSDAEVRKFLTDNTLDNGHVQMGLSIGKIDELANAASVRLFVNLAVYLSDLRARGQYDPNIPHNAKKLARTHHHAPDHPGKRWEFGREIKLQPELRALARSSASADPAWRLQSRFMVRGHWRNQAWGPGMKEHRRKWIEPFWKGPAEGERLDRAYKVE